MAILMHSVDTQRYLFLFDFFTRVLGGSVAQWIMHRPTEPGIAGSSPAGVICDYIVNAVPICHKHFTRDVQVTVVNGLTCVMRCVSAEC